MDSGQIEPNFSCFTVLFTNLTLPNGKSRFNVKFYYRMFWTQIGLPCINRLVLGGALLSEAKWV